MRNAVERHLKVQGVMSAFDAPALTARDIEILTDCGFDYAAYSLAAARDLVAALKKANRIPA